MAAAPSVVPAAAVALADAVAWKPQEDDAVLLGLKPSARAGCRSPAVCHRCLVLRRPLRPPSRPLRGPRSRFRSCRAPGSNHAGLEVVPALPDEVRVRAADPLHRRGEGRAEAIVDRGNVGALGLGYAVKGLTDVASTMPEPLSEEEQVEKPASPAALEERA